MNVEDRRYTLAFGTERVRAWTQVSIPLLQGGGAPETCGHGHDPPHLTMPEVGSREIGR